MCAIICNKSSSSSCSWRVRRVSCSLILRMKLVPPSLLRSSYFPSSFDLYRNACFGILFLSILCTCCSHFFRHCFISSTMLFALVFSLIHWFFSLSNFVIPSKCLKNFICAASKRCFSLFFSTQVSLPNFNAALAVMLWILNFVSLFICFPKYLRIIPFILLYVCNLSFKSLLYSDIRYPWYLKSVTCSIILSLFVTSIEDKFLLLAGGTARDCTTNPQDSSS